ncbi:MAG: hypothetical protein GF311_11390 [Candidatus Lokiarchaeota archaeon]|nr:hypothetical protein [Candidatus Lokiarchaeota archaeon]
MKKIQISIGIVISFLILPSMSIIFTPTVRADTYSNDFDISKEYVYNVTEWDQELNWYYTSDKGWLNSSKGGQIRVNFTGFYDYVSPVWDPNAFENPLPFINISFYEKTGDSISLNRTMINQSSAETANVMALGYHYFDAGFLIPNKNFTLIQNRVAAQNESGFWELSSYDFEEFLKMIRITFKQKSGGQNTTLIYDKETGILVWANVQSAFATDFKFQLNDYTLDFTPMPNIPSFPIMIVGAISSLTIGIAIFIKRKKFKLK